MTVCVCVVADMSCCQYERCGLLDTITQLPSQGWYYGNISLPQAERLLKDEPNGAFLIHDSTDSNATTELFTITFKISYRFGSVRVDYAKGYFSLSLQDPGLPLFKTMMDLVSFCYHMSTVQKRPVCVLSGRSSQQHNFHLYLTKPVSRHKQLHSLQFLCRDAIHKLVTRDQLERLPLPKRLLELYMYRNPLFDEQLFPVEEKELCEDDACSEGGGSSRSSLALETGNDE